MAQNFFQVDDRQGNAYTICDVTHVTGTASTFQVDQSAVSVTHSNVSGGTQLNTETSPSTGISLGSASSGLKTVTVASGVASGTITIVTRHAGSAAGIGSFKTPHA